MRLAPARLWSAATAAAADRHTMETLGVPSTLLMERASLAVSHEIASLLAGERLPVLVLVGPGNNGGDGLAVARQLRGWGIAARIRLTTARRNEVAEAQLALARAMGVPIEEGVPPGPARGRHVIVDALLGTGSRGQPRGAIAEALRWQRGLAGPRVAVDAPTGVDIDTGEAVDEAFSADLTVTFVRSKPGLHVVPGRSLAGRVVVADIGIVAPPDEDRDRCALIDAWAVADAISSLPPGRHKGERGHLAIVGGSETTAGATVLAGAAALRASVGLVTIVTRAPEVREQILAHRPELMVAPWEENTAPVPAAKALVVGPGLTDSALHGRLSALWTDDPRPAVWDASALDHLPLHRDPAGPRIVTPHPGEAARMLARAATRSEAMPDVRGRRLTAALALAEVSHAIAVLKGEGTIVAAPGGRCSIAVTGGPVLATAGTGDCLAGLMGALLARGLEPWQAATAAVHVHGLAGDVAAARWPGSVAMDVADALGHSMQGETLRQPLAGWPAHRLG